MTDKVIGAKKLPRFKADHINKWVVFSADSQKILSVGDTLLEAVESAPNVKNKGVMLVPEPLPYSPSQQ
jgi:hypothetical protein